MDDLISRSELIAQLEDFKVALGDIVLGFVVDRVIERVQEMPAAEKPIRERLDLWDLPPIGGFHGDD